MKTIILLSLLALMVLNSCFYAYYPQTGCKTYSPTQAENITIYSGLPEQEYIVMGSIATDVIGNSDAAVSHLKKKAAQMGADAVIKVRITTNSKCGGTGVSGVVVKMKQNGLAEVQTH